MIAIQHVEQLSFFDARPSGQPRRHTSEAALRKSNGQFLALKRAGKVWHDNAMMELEKYLKKIKGNKVNSFTFEDFRLHCEVQGLSEPASLNAWGAIPNSARRAGLCAWSGGFQQATRPASHSRFIKTWIAL